MRDSVTAGEGLVFVALELGAADSGGLGVLVVFELESAVACSMFARHHLGSLLLEVERQTLGVALAPDLRLHRKGRKSDRGDLWIPRKRLRVGYLAIFSGLVNRPGRRPAIK